MREKPYVSHSEPRCPRCLCSAALMLPGAVFPRLLGLSRNTGKTQGSPSASPAGSGFFLNPLLSHVHPMKHHQKLFCPHQGPLSAAQGPEMPLHPSLTSSIPRREGTLFLLRVAVCPGLCRLTPPVIHSCMACVCLGLRSTWWIWWTRCSEPVLLAHAQHPCKHPASRDTRVSVLGQAPRSRAPAAPGPQAVAPVTPWPDGSVATPAVFGTGVKTQLLR